MLNRVADKVGGGVESELFDNSRAVRFNRSWADKELLRNSAVRHSVRKVEEDFSLALTQL